MLRFLVDECLTPRLAGRARSRGYEALHVTWAGREGTSDPRIVKFALEGNFTVVTNNAKDFKRLYRRIDIHAGLVIILPVVDVDRQLDLFANVLDAVEARSDLVNCLVEVNEVGKVNFSDIGRDSPSSPPEQS